ncbi:M4 family metallopeptidase [Longispora albida]|uniref:M4 family metallopeptidase n=1 Tax=Longispora albida TaxID=203523 RepID=UPI00035C33D8|nr:M4 family metallopeptidase [Longispora albida]
MKLQPLIACTLLAVLAAPAQPAAASATLGPATVTGQGTYNGSVSLPANQRPDLQYELTDPTRGNNKVLDCRTGTGSPIVSPDPVFGGGFESIAVDAMYALTKTWDYFKNTHGRAGMAADGKGVTICLRNGTAGNATWDGTKLLVTIGSDGKALTSLDIIGHELAHGYTEHMVAGGLTYSGESGGLNEATSDIFGTMVEYSANSPGDQPDYLIGEKVDIFGNGTPLRYMYNPPLDGSSHGCWSTSTQSVDVHYSSGVGNHFFYNLAEGNGSLSPACAGAPPVTGIGRAKAERIWYRALDFYFTSNTRYVSTGSNARNATLNAAADLYGRCSTEYRAVQAAWTSVKVAGNDASCDNLIGNGTFEAGATAWTGTAGVVTNSASRPALSGTWKAWLGGDGVTGTETLTQSVTFPGTPATLTFWLRIDTAEKTTTVAYDRLTVYAGTTQLGTFSNLNAGAAFQKVTYPVTAGAGPLAVRFVSTEDVSLQTSFVIDDVTLTV